MFTFSKDKYLETLYTRIKTQLELLFNLRKKLKLASQETADLVWRAYRDAREAISVRKDHIPAMLKDVFELFVDSHFKKGLLTLKKLIDEAQKRKIRSAVLQCCAFCGPDSEFDPGKQTTTKFLDFHRITGDDEYENGEGLIICIKWYISILEDGKTAKRDVDTMKKLKTILDDLNKVLIEQARAAQAQQVPTEAAGNNGDVVMTNVAEIDANLVR